MSQQINLYTPPSRGPSRMFSAAWTVAAAGAVLLIFAVDYAWETGQLPGVRARRVEAAEQLRKIREQMQSLSNAAQKPRSKALEDEVGRAELRVKGTQELIERLRGGDIGNREGYSALLDAFARQRVEGLWLTNIEIHGPQSDIAVQGRSLRADLVPTLIARLREEHAMRGKAIGTLSLQERDIDPRGTQEALPEAQAPVSPAPGGDKAGPRARVRVVEFRVGSAAPADGRERGK